MAEADDAPIRSRPNPMTIDRRFDRLERTKADRSKLRRLTARVNRCATRADLKRLGASPVSRNA